MFTKRKIKKITELRTIVLSLKRRGKRVVFTNGCFDLIHYGHIRYLETARGFGDCLIVALNSDRSVKKIKDKTRPILPQSDRARILAALACVDFVVIFNEPNPLRLIKEIEPDVLVKGGDWNKKHVIGADFVRSYNGLVKIVPFLKNRSTSSIIKSIIRRHAK
jgi:D-beta-D-heptose 7-phosphate kinase/D-beta-D-heptose 1-phosphate adenosyltransferase